MKKTTEKTKRTRIVLFLLIAVIYLALSAVILRFSELDPLAVGGVMIICFLLTELLFDRLYHLIRARFSRDDEEHLAPLLGNVTLDLILKLNQPVVICDRNGKIIWYNKAFLAVADQHDVMYAKTINDVSGLSVEALLADIRSEQPTDGVDTSVYDRFFRIKGFQVTAQGKDYLITVWNERTELTAMTKQLADEEMIIAYIMVDNLDELMQFVQEKYRTASAEVEAILKEWADSVGGVLKEYERDRFLFLFEAKYLDEFIEKKFDILDKIREVRIGEGSMPVTVSMGISRIKGTFAEKERDAHASLDLALQRGGDQVVVKNPQSTDFYGGRTKTVQKRTKVRARVIAGELTMRMANAHNVIVMGHRNPDYDSIGACVGIARLAMYCGVPVNIIAGPDDRDIKASIDRISVLPDYEHVLIDAVAGQDLIHPDTLLVIVDVNNPVQFASPEIAENVASVVIIDHHRKTGELKTQPIINYMEPSASSASELVAEILEQAMPAGSLHSEEADVLYAGMLLDTKQFSRNTGVRTFSAALYLRAEGADPVEAQLFFKSGLDEYLREAKFAQNVITYRKIFAISLCDGAGSSEDRIAAAKAADKLLTVIGVQASFALVEIDGSVHISARSNGSVNVQLILERLGGGGYYEAAGAFLQNMSMTSALNGLKEAIDGYVNEL